MNTSNASASITIGITRKDAENKQVFGWAYVTEYTDGVLVLDKWKAHIPHAVLRDAVYRFVGSGGVFCDAHARDDKGRPVVSGFLIESWFCDEEKTKAMGIKVEGPYAVGWWAGFQITNDALWQKIANGEYQDLSIGGNAVFHYIDDQPLEDALKASGVRA